MILAKIKSTIFGKLLITVNGKKETAYFSTQKVDTLTLSNGKKIRQFTLDIGTDAKNIKQKGVKMYENIGFQVHILPNIMAYQACDDVVGTPFEFLCYEDKNVGLLRFTDRTCDDVSLPLVPVGATWTYSYKSRIPGFFHTFPKSKCVKDTMILNRQCSKIDVGYNVCFPYGNPLFLTYENSKTYLLNNGKFTLLYDFYDGQKGATWKFAYAYSAGAQTKYDTIKFIVEDVSIIPNLNRYIKKFKVSLQRRDANGAYKTYYKGDLFDRIGFNEHILPRTNLFPCDDVDGYIEELRCYSEVKDAFEIKFTTKKCESTSSLPNVQEQFEVSVFPNPSAGTFFIKLQNTDFQRGDLHVFNQQGQKIYTQKITASVENQSIELRNTPNGLYFWQLTLDGQLVKNGKMIIAN